MMSNPLPRYVDDLAALDQAERHMLPMSIRPGGEVLSLYGDPEWDLWPHIQTRNQPANSKRICFRIKLPDGRLLIDPEHAGLLESVRAYLYVRLSKKHPARGVTLKHSSLLNTMRSVKKLLYWMVSNRYRQFSELTPAACMAFAQDVKRQKMAKFTMVRTFSVVEHLYLFRKYLVDALPESPWPGTSACYLAGRRLTGPQRGKTEQIPYRLYTKLAQGSLRYVESGYGKQLLACREAYENCYSENYPEKNKAIATHLQTLQLKNWQAVRKELHRLYTACYVIIDMFSGLRDCEMVSLELSCYQDHEGWDGARYGWIKGLTYKLEKNPKPVEWRVPPVVAKAVSLAERVSAPIRAELESSIVQLEKKLDLEYVRSELRLEDQDALYKLMQCRQSLFVNYSYDDAINPWSNNWTNQRLKEFAAHLDLRVEAEDLGQIMDRDSIVVGDIWPLACHQFRRTFAVTVARITFGDLLYLRRHLQHWSLDMTLAYAFSEQEYIDTSLFDEVLGQRDELQTTIVEVWLDPGNRITGEGAVGIKEFRQREEVRVAKDHRDLARKLQQGFFIRATGHSWCTAEKCRGLGIYNVLECEHCENRIIDRTHLPVWRGIRYQQIELLQMDDLGDPMWQRAKNHLIYAEKILRELGEEVESYPIPPMPSLLRQTAGCNV